jgi:hypothetical protein
MSPRVKTLLQWREFFRAAAEQGEGRLLQGGRNGDSQLERGEKKSDVS